MLRCFYSIFTLHMPNPGHYQHDDRHEICIYPDLKIVLKIFMDSEVESYRLEKEFYRTFASWQGSGIPRLLGSGNCCCDGRPFLILSYEGEPVGSDLSQDEK